jgi:mono/diheme cytochrome c family protein
MGGEVEEVMLLPGKAIRYTRWPLKNNSNRRNCLMRLISLTLTCIAIAMLAVACTESEAPTNTPKRSAAAPSPAASVDEFASARANYAKHCEACHGPEGVGGLVKVEKKQIKVPSLKAEHAIKHPDDKITKQITNGEEEMPAFKDKMTTQEISEMVRFVRKHFQGK